LAAKSFKRWNGVLLLVVDLPDGSRGTVPADATDVLGDCGQVDAVSVLNAAGLRELYSVPAHPSADSAAPTRLAPPMAYICCTRWATPSL
jgi:hypothetical protein